MSQYTGPAEYAMSQQQQPVRAVTGAQQMQRGQNVAVAVETAELVPTGPVALQPSKSPPLMGAASLGQQPLLAPQPLGASPRPLPPGLVRAWLPEKWNMVAAPILPEPRGLPAAATALPATAPGTHRSVQQTSQAVKRAPQGVTTAPATAAAASAGCTNANVATGLAVAAPGEVRAKRTVPIYRERATNSQQADKVCKSPVNGAAPPSAVVSAAAVAPSVPEQSVNQKPEAPARRAAVASSTVHPVAPVIPENSTEAPGQGGQASAAPATASSGAGAAPNQGRPNQRTPQKQQQGQDAATAKDVTPKEPASQPPGADASAVDLDAATEVVASHLQKILDQSAHDSPEQVVKTPRAVSDAAPGAVHAAATSEPATAEAAGGTPQSAKQKRIKALRAASQKAASHAVRRSPLPELTAPSTAAAPTTAAVQTSPAAASGPANADRQLPAPTPAAKATAGATAATSAGGNAAQKQKVTPTHAAAEGRTPPDAGAAAQDPHSNGSRGPRMAEPARPAYSGHGMSPTRPRVARELRFEKEPASDDQPACAADLKRTEQAAPSAAEQRKVREYAMQGKVPDGVSLAATPECKEQQAVGSNALIAAGGRTKSSGPQTPKVKGGGASGARQTSPSRTSTKGKGAALDPKQVGHRNSLSLPLSLSLILCALHISI